MIRAVVPKLFWFADHLEKLVVREGQNIDLYRDSRTTSANLADHQWSAEQTLGITGLEHNQRSQINRNALKVTKMQSAQKQL